MGKSRTILVIAALLCLACGFAAFRQPTAFHPVVTFDSSAGPPLPEQQESSLTFSFVFDAMPSLQRCEAVSGRAARVVLLKCPACTIQQLRCAPALTEAESALLSDRPLSYPSGRMQYGAVSFVSDNPELALAACRTAAEQSARGPQPITCYEPDTVRPRPVHPLTDGHAMLLASLLLLAAALASWSACWLIVKYEHLHGRFSHDQAGGGPQKVHATLTPRIGGLGLLAGLTAAGVALAMFVKLPMETNYELLLLASMPAFLGGLVEDVTKRLPVITRLLLTMLSAAVAAWLMGAVLPRIDVPGVDLALRWLPFAVAFTVFAVGGVANATNIIDGFNGLSSGYALVALLGFCVVAGENGDLLVFASSLALAGALLGFFDWNWPRGRIFLGDSGAYLLGFLLAELAVLLVARNPEVSPWFPVLLLVYPIFETLFSMYRRHVVRGLSPGDPDALHLHTLVYRRLVPRRDVNGVALSKLERNGRVAKYFWVPALVLGLLACLFWRSTPALVALALGYCAAYVTCYRRIVYWKSPGLHLKAR